MSMRFMNKGERAMSRTEWERIVLFLREEGWQEQKITSFLNRVTEGEAERQYRAAVRIKTEYPQHYVPEELLGTDLDGYVTMLDAYY